MTVSGTNFGKAADDYGTFRAGFPDSIFERLAEFNVGLAGHAVIDLGTGTGTLARGFALRGCDVVGVDPDPRMIRKAKSLDRQSKITVQYAEAKAESTGLGSDVADVVSAGQCWHWFDQPTVIAEAIRLLKPAGKLVIANFDWLPLAGNVVEATEELILRYNPDWQYSGGVGMYPHYLPVLTAASMQNIQTFSYDLDVPYTPEAWRGRIRASAGVAALDTESVARFDADLLALLATRFAGSNLAVPHRVFAIIAATAAT